MQTGYFKATLFGLPKWLKCFHDSAAVLPLSVHACSQWGVTESVTEQLRELISLVGLLGGLLSWAFHCGSMEWRRCTAEMEEKRATGKQKLIMRKK